MDEHVHGVDRLLLEEREEPYRPSATLIIAAAVPVATPARATG